MICNNVFEEWNEIDKNVFCFPLLTEHFCESLVIHYNNSMEKEEKMIIEKEKNIIIDGITIVNFCMDNIWNNLLLNYIKPLILKKLSYFVTKDVNTFVSRNIPFFHNHSSLFTVHIVLNKTKEEKLKTGYCYIYYSNDGNYQLNQKNDNIILTSYLE